MHGAQPSPPSCTTTSGTPCLVLPVLDTTCCSWYWLLLPLLTILSMCPGENDNSKHFSPLVVTVSSSNTLAYSDFLKSFLSCPFLTSYMNFTNNISGCFRLALKGPGFISASKLVAILSTSGSYQTKSLLY